MRRLRLVFAASAFALASLAPLAPLSFVAVAQATTPVTNPKSNCLDHTALVVMSEQDGGAWKTVFRPQGKGKDICGYSFFTRGDVDGDGRDEIALRIDRGEGYGYRVIKRKKGSYDLLGK